MYNIHSHYENVFNYLKTITEEPVLLYFYPFGAINYENIEMFHCNGRGKGPVILCFDQEPIIEDFEQLVVKFIDHWGVYRPKIILNTETRSQIKDSIIDKFSNQFVYDCNYFFHIFAASDWYRGYKFNAQIVKPSIRKINKKFITFNRITGKSRSYRGIFIANLIEKNLLDYGHVSFSRTCPEHGSYSESAFEIIKKYNVNQNIVQKSIEFLYQTKNNLRIDQVEQEFISNSSQTIECLPQLMESFVYIVTETCFWDSKTHLTEKIFKPIVSKHPFILLGCKGNLHFLKKYGFQTFNNYWDESYDEIDDPIQRILAVSKIIEDLCSYSNDKLETMLKDMESILDYNYNLFYSEKFINCAWNELQTNLHETIEKLQFQIV